MIARYAHLRKKSTTLIHHIFFAYIPKSSDMLDRLSSPSRVTRASISFRRLHKSMSMTSGMPIGYTTHMMVAYDWTHS